MNAVCISSSTISCAGGSTRLESVEMESFWGNFSDFLF